MNRSARGALVLVPNQLGDNPRPMFADHPLTQRIIIGLDGLLAENSRGARLLLKRINHRLPIQVMQKSEGRSTGFNILDLIANGQRWGLVTDAGWPAIADPGADLIFEARKKELQIEICAGTSSLMLALALSGLPSQSFAFHGYLPIQRELLNKKLSEICRTPIFQSHLFIETPYRNQRFLEALVQQLPANWWLSTCCALSLEDENVITLQLAKWKKLKDLVQIKKKPTVFVISSRA